ncbi:MAG: peptide-methionine (S)-S-oxide reductase MsrA [Candidatus Izemoplasmatales bacterium]|jgi:peptide-methionine (S)-S-oxide reductase|nr:peptide-methionine (S)-S-oxide reductase MsrA [Candidatus Izemoplasmatales bacterium]
MKEIILAGGCFWGVEAYYKRLKGVIDTQVGYTDGPQNPPCYRDVCNHSGHVEAVKISYDPSVIPFDAILDHFFRIIDPTEVNRQGSDIGIQYRSAIYIATEDEKRNAKAWIDRVQLRYAKKIQTEVKMSCTFFDAEAYHQDYLDKNPTGYCHVRMHLAKDEELKEEYRVSHSS